MKILIIDDTAHEELGKALREYGIILEQKQCIPDKTEEGSYALVILCPQSVETLRIMFDRLVLRRMKPIVLYENTNDRFINFCTKLGCVDVVSKPYKAEMLARRLWSVIESISSEENGGLIRESCEIQISVEDFIKREIKNVSRAQIPLGFIAVDFADDRVSSDTPANLMQKIKKCLRDTDFITFYGELIVIMLPGCKQDEIEIVQNKLLICAGDTNIYFYGYVKDKFYEKNPVNELEKILSTLRQGMQKVIHESGRQTGA